MIKGVIFDKDGTVLDYEQFCKANGLTPAEVLMVGDTPTDLRFARNSGASFLGVGVREADRAILMAEGDPVVRDISEIFSVLS